MKFKILIMTESLYRATYDESISDNNLYDLCQRFIEYKKNNQVKHWKFEYAHMSNDMLGRVIRDIIGSDISFINMLYNFRDDKFI